MSALSLFASSDHAGFEWKEALKKISFPFAFHDLGPTHGGPVDYSDYVEPVVSKVLSSPQARGLLICGSGVGMCVGANRFKGIRAMVGHGEEEVRLGRSHNNINVLCLAARLISFETALRLISIFMTHSFEGGRHEKRLEKLDAYKTCQP